MDCEHDCGDFKPRDCEIVPEPTEIVGAITGMDCVPDVITLNDIRYVPEAEVERLRTWDGLMQTLDAHWPADVFTGESGDSGPRIVALIRWVERLQAIIDAAWSALAQYGTDSRVDLAEDGESPEDVTVDVGIQQLGEVAYQWLAERDSFADQIEQYEAMKGGALVRIADLKAEVEQLQATIGELQKWKDLALWHEANCDVLPRIILGRQDVGLPPLPQAAEAKGGTDGPDGH